MCMYICRHLEKGHLVCFSRVASATETRIAKVGNHRVHQQVLGCCISTADEITEKVDFKVLAVHCKYEKEGMLYSIVVM